jgi:hypothetical protein
MKNKQLIIRKIADFSSSKHERKLAFTTINPTTVTYNN